MGIGEMVGWRPMASAGDKLGKSKTTSVLEEQVALISERPCFDLDDDDLEISSSKPLSRCVFGGPPTLQELKATTSELTHALELEKISENGSNHASRKIIKCVQLFQTPGCQDLFYSIASDPNVYSAMLKNPAVTDFVHSYQTNSPPSLEMLSSVTERVSRLDFICDEHLKNSSLFEKLIAQVKDLAQIAKTRVVGMVSYLSNRVYNIFGTSSAVHVGHPIDKSTSTDAYVASLAWFALVVIVLVVFKRKI